MSGGYRKDVYGAIFATISSGESGESEKYCSSLPNRTGILSGEVMDAETFDRYLADRYEDQVAWYSRKASANKRLYHIFQWGVIVLSAAVPVLVAVVPAAFHWVTILVSVVLAIGTTGLKTFKFQENWVNYRTVSEMLIKERHFYDAGLGDYGASKKKQALFVERAEALMSTENILWVKTHRQKEEEKKKADRGNERK